MASVTQADIDRIVATVAAEDTAADSIIALVNGLTQFIRDHATDSTALLAAADAADAKTAEIVAAVAANTPVQPAQLAAKKK